MAGADPSSVPGSPVAADGSTAEVRTDAASASDGSVAGVYDERYTRRLLRAAAWTCALFAVLVVGLAWAVLGRSSVSLPRGQSVDGSFADRAAFAAIALGLLVGAGLLAFAGVLAAIEVRARLQSTRSTETTTTTRGAEGFAPLDVVSTVVTKVVEVLAQARGTAIVALAGLTVVVIALVQVGNLGDTSTSLGTSGDDATTTSSP